MTSAVSLFCCQAPSGCYAEFRYRCPGYDRNLWGMAGSCYVVTFPGGRQVCSVTCCQRPFTFCAWQRGNGALANMALDRALADDPVYTMAQLLRQAIDSGA